MAMQPKAWMIAILFDIWNSHFITSIQTRGRNLALINRHLLILNGHNSHVTINIVHKVKRVGLDPITPPSHTSHALQPLDVACFKPFKTAFRAYKGV
jgi:hypothetical protein